MTMATNKKTAQVKTTKPDMVKEAKSPIVLSHDDSVGRSRQRLYLLLALLVMALGIGAYALKNQFVVASVNGKLITRNAYIKEMERQVGKSTLDTLILEALIQQESEKTGKFVGDEVVQSEVAALETQFEGQNQNLDDLLELEGMTRADLAKQIRFQKLVELLAPEASAPSEAEVKAYIADNEMMFDEKAEEKEKIEQATEQLQTQSNRSKINDWLEMLKEQANISYWN